MECTNTDRMVQPSIRMGSTVCALFPHYDGTSNSHNERYPIPHLKGGNVIIYKIEAWYVDAGSFHGHVYSTAEGWRLMADAMYGGSATYDPVLSLHKPEEPVEYEELHYELYEDEDEDKRELQVA